MLNDKNVMNAFDEFYHELHNLPEYLAENPHCGTMQRAYLRGQATLFLRLGVIRFRDFENLIREIASD